jgi:hypothetical protein
MQTIIERLIWDKVYVKTFDRMVWKEEGQTIMAVTTEEGILDLWFTFSRDYVAPIEETIEE